MIGATTATPATAPSLSPRKAAPQLGQADFLRLMTTQLSAQDPFKPVDNTQMIAQMAQFSQVAGIGEINASLRTLVARGSGGVGGAGDLSGWIGRSVLAEDAPLVADADGTYRGELAFAADASDRRWTAIDANGAVVAEGEAAAGTTTLPIAIARDAAAPLRLVAPGAQSRAAWLPVAAIQDPAGNARLATPAGPIEPARVRRLA